MKALTAGEASRVRKIAATSERMGSPARERKAMLGMRMVAAATLGKDRDTQAERNLGQHGDQAAGRADDLRIEASPPRDLVRAGVSLSMRKPELRN
jgi:hypothetical protein